MPRIAKPRVWRNKYVTEAGGRLHELCDISEGRAKAHYLLVQHLARLQQEELERKVEPLPYTLEEVAAEFLTLTESSRRTKTYEHYQRNLQRLVLWYGSHEIRAIRLSHGTDYLKRLNALKVGNTTINHHIRSASAVFNYAVDAGLISENPWQRMPKRPEKSRKRIASDDEFEILLTACNKYRSCGDLDSKTNAQLMKDILMVLRFTGLRPGEVRILRWDHLRWDENLIVFPPHEHKTGTMTRQPCDRIIEFSDVIKEIFAKRRLANHHERLVFPNPSGEIWTDEALSRRFARLCAKAGLRAPDANGECLCLYNLRHTRCTELAAGGMQPHALAQQAGNSVKTCERYVHLSRKEISQALRSADKPELQRHMSCL